MQSLSEILTNQYSNQGIQDLKIFYDSCFFNLKIKDNSHNYNVVLIEKIEFDYKHEKINKLKNGIVVNFGDTQTDSPLYSFGNCYLDSFLIPKYKNVFLVGLKQTITGNTIPVIYCYNINNHSIKPIFPTQSDIDQFNSINNQEFDSDYLPVVRFIDNKIHLLFQTTKCSFQYIHKIIFDVFKESVILSDYQIFRYSDAVEFENVNSSFLNFKTNNYHGVIRLLNSDEYATNPVVFVLDNNEIVLTLDDYSSMILDYEGIIESLPVEEITVEELDIYTVIYLDNSESILTLDDCSIIDLDGSDYICNGLEGDAILSLGACDDLLGADDDLSVFRLDEVEIITSSTLCDGITSNDIFSLDFNCLSIFGADNSSDVFLLDSVEIIEDSVVCEGITSNDIFSLDFNCLSIFGADNSSDVFLLDAVEIISNECASINSNDVFSLDATCESVFGIDDSSSVLRFDQ